MASGLGTPLHQNEGIKGQRTTDSDDRQLAAERAVLRAYVEIFDSPLVKELIQNRNAQGNGPVIENSGHSTENHDRQLALDRGVLRAYAEIFDSPSVYKNQFVKNRNTQEYGPEIKASEKSVYKNQFVKSRNAQENGPEITSNSQPLSTQQRQRIPTLPEEAQKEASRCMTRSVRILCSPSGDTFIKDKNAKTAPESETSGQSASSSITSSGQQSLRISTPPTEAQKGPSQIMIRSWRGRCGPSGDTFVKDRNEKTTSESETSEQLISNSMTISGQQRVRIPTPPKEDRKEQSRIMTRSRRLLYGAQISQELTAQTQSTNQHVKGKRMTPGHSIKENQKRNTTAKAKRAPLQNSEHCAEASSSTVPSLPAIPRGRVNLTAH